MTTLTFHDGDSAKIEGDPQMIRIPGIATHEDTAGKPHDALGAEQTADAESLNSALNLQPANTSGTDAFGRPLTQITTQEGTPLSVLSRTVGGVAGSPYASNFNTDPDVPEYQKRYQRKLAPHIPGAGLYSEDGKPTAQLLEGVRRVKLLEWATQALKENKITPEKYKEYEQQTLEADPDLYLDGNAHLKGLHADYNATPSSVPHVTSRRDQDPRNVIEQFLGGFSGASSTLINKSSDRSLWSQGTSDGILRDVIDYGTELSAKPTPEDEKDFENLKLNFSEQDLKSSEKMPLPQRLAHLKNLARTRKDRQELANLAGADSFTAQAFGLLSMVPGIIATDGMLGVAGKGTTSALEYADSIAAKRIATKYEADLATHISESKALMNTGRPPLGLLMQDKVAQDTTLRAAAEADITVGLTPQATAAKWAQRQKEALWSITPKALQDNLTNNAAYWKFGYQAAVKSPAMLYGFTEATDTLHGFVFNEDKTEGFHHLTPEEYGMGLAFGLLGHGASPAYKQLTGKYDRLKKLQENLGIDEGTTASYKATSSGAIIDSDAAANLREVNEILKTHSRDKTPFSAEQEARLQELRHVKDDLRYLSTDLEKSKHYEDLSTELDKGISPADAKDLDLRPTLNALTDPEATPIKNHPSFLTPVTETGANLGNVRELLGKLQQGELRADTASMLQFSGTVNNILKALDTGHDWVEKKDAKYRYKQTEKYRALSGASATRVQNAITSLVTNDKFKALSPEAQAKVLEPIAHHQLLRSDLHKDITVRQVALADGRPVHIGVIGKHLIDTSKMKDGAAKDKATKVNQYLTEVHKRFDTEYQGTYFNGQIFKDLLAKPDWKKDFLDQTTHQAISHAVELNPNIRDWLKSENHENFVEELTKDYAFNVKEQKFKLKEEDSSVTDVDPLPEGTTAPKLDPETAVC